MRSDLDLIREFSFLPDENTDEVPTPELSSAFDSSKDDGTGEGVVETDELQKRAPGS